MRIHICLMYQPSPPTACDIVGYHARCTIALYHVPSTRMRPNYSFVYACMPNALGIRIDNVNTRLPAEEEIIAASSRD